MTPQDEKYCHLKECIDSLNAAWLVCKELVEHSTTPRIYDAALRFALIAYSRPYTSSDGKHGYGRTAYRRAVPTSLSQEQLDLHHQVLMLRHKEIAHSDLTVREFRMGSSRYAESGQPVVCQNLPTSLPDLEPLRLLIEATLRELYKERESFIVKE